MHSPSGREWSLHAADLAPKTNPDKLLVMFVIDRAGVLRYNGAIDSDPSSDPDDFATAENYAAAALDALLAGKKMSKPVTRPYGCSVKYKS